MKELMDFHCPRWEELPEKELFNPEVVDYVSALLSPLMPGEKILTGTMIQNYLKWGILNKGAGRKYNREQIATLIVLSIYKQILPIGDLRKGMDLMLSKSDSATAYNRFAEALEQAIRRTALSVRPEGIRMEGMEASSESVGVHLIAHAFSMKLFGKTVIEKNGFVNIGGRYE